MKFTTRMFGAALAAGVLAASLAGCGAGPAGSSSPWTAWKSPPRSSSIG